MPTIEVSEDQRAYLEDLRERLTADHVGAYGHVRPRDALQYLIDSNEGDVAAETDDAASPGGDTADGTDDAADDDAGGSSDGADDAADGTTTMNAMMSLLETHEDKWGDSDDEDARYVVHLSDGDEHVRTKGEVKALLFKNFR